MLNPTVFHVKGTVRITAPTPLARGTIAKTLKLQISMAFFFCGSRGSDWQFWIRAISLRPVSGKNSTWLARIFFYAINAEANQSQESLRKELRRQFPVPTRVSKEFLLEPVNITRLKMSKAPLVDLLDWFETVIQPLINEQLIKLNTDFLEEVHEQLRTRNVD
jgi:hypothetical protein